MLNIFYNLEPFFEDVYSELSVREYARIKRCSPPTASKLLKGYAKEGLLISGKDRIYLLFRANRENDLFKDLARSYWKNRLSELLKDIHKDFLFEEIILFGSIAKIENTLNSDMDLYINIQRKEIDLSNIERKLKRKLQLHFKDSLKNKNLSENIKKGVRIK